MSGHELASVVEEPAAPPVRVTRLARRFIRNHGGFAYVWLRPFAGSNWAVAASIRRPPDTEFELRSDEMSVRVFTAEYLGATPGIVIGLRWFPRPTLDAYFAYGGESDPIGAANG